MTDQDLPVFPTPRPIPAPAENVYPSTVRMRMLSDPEFAAAETSLLLRNGIDPQRVLIDTYERHGSAVSFEHAVLDAQGQRIIDRSDPEDLRLETEDVARVLAVYP